MAKRSKEPRLVHGEAHIDRLLKDMGYEPEYESLPLIIDGKGYSGDFVLHAHRVIVEVTWLDKALREKRFALSRMSGSTPAVHAQREILLAEILDFEARWERKQTVLKQAPQHGWAVVLVTFDIWKKTLNNPALLENLVEEAAQQAARFVAA